MTWSTWTNGMPQGALINEFDYVDSLAINGTFYVAACTYGRGIWIREVSGDDPLGIHKYENENLFLSQNTDNPGSGLTNFIYANSYNGMVNLSVTDVTGKVITVLVNSFQVKGKHQVQLDRKFLQDGIYFYKLTCGLNTITQKMIVIH